MAICNSAVIPEVVIGDPGTFNGWVPDNDFGNDELATVAHFDNTAFINSRLKPQPRVFPNSQRPLLTMGNFNTH
jgi:hypothetical protein